MRSIFASLVVGLVMISAPAFAGNVIYIDDDGNAVLVREEQQREEQQNVVYRRDETTAAQPEVQIARTEGNATYSGEPTTEDASFGQFGPIGRPAQIGQSAPIAQGGAPCYNPQDPGCCSGGGNCGKQLDSWNHTWDRMHLPREPGNGARGTYLPGGGYAPYGQGVPMAGIQGFNLGRHGRHGFGGGQQYGGVQTWQGPTQQRMVTVTTAENWIGRRINGRFFCLSGSCPANGIYGN